MDINPIIIGQSVTGVTRLLKNEEFRQFMEALAEQLTYNLYLGRQLSKALRTDLPRQIREFVELCMLDREQGFKLSGLDPRRSNSDFTPEAGQVWVEGHTWHVYKLEGTLVSVISWMEEHHPSDGVTYWRGWLNQHHLMRQQ